MGQHEHLWAAWVAAGPGAVLSHESALRLHGLSDVTPRWVHFWIPFDRRPRLPRSILHGVKYHVTRRWLKPEEITLVDGLQVTTPLRTLLDVALSGTTPDQIVVAIKQALERKWVKIDELSQGARARGPKVAERIKKLLREATGEKYNTPEAFRQALATYLSRRSGELDIPFEVLQRRLVFQRFLARLLQVAPDRWVLSGGVALDWRLAAVAQRTRTTVDLDFLYRSTQDQARNDMEKAAAVSLDDYFTFVVAPGAQVTEERQTSVRYNVTAYLGRRPYLSFSVDVGILDPLRWAPDQVVLPDLFEDLGFGQVTVPTLAIAH